MRIAISARPLAHNAGIGRHARGIVEALLKTSPQNQYKFFTNKTAVLPNEMGTVRPKVVDKIIPGRVGWEQTVLPMRIALSGTDLYFSADFTTPVFSPVPTVVMCHDLFFLTHPQNSSWRARFLYNSFVPPSLRKSGAVVTMSTYYQNKISEAYGIDRRKIFIIPGAVSPIFKHLDEQESRDYVGRKFGLFDPYILSVATFEKRKNLGTLIEAFGLLKEKYKGRVSLALVGKAGNADSQMADAKEKLGEHAQDVRVLGRVSDDDLVRLYCGATIYSMPSTDEGFGLPVLEAMACGTPVVASRASAIPEVAGDAAILCDPTEPDQFADAIKSILENNNLYGDLVTRGLQRASNYTYENSAKLLLDVFDYVMEKKNESA